MFVPAREFDAIAPCPAPFGGAELFGAYPHHDRLPFTAALASLQPAEPSGEMLTALALLHSLVSEGSNLRDDAALHGAEHALRCGAMELASWFLAALGPVPLALEPRRARIAEALATAPYVPPPFSNDPGVTELTRLLDAEIDGSGPVWIYGNLGALLVVQRPHRAWRFAIPGTTLEANVRRYDGRPPAQALIAQPLPDQAVHANHVGTVAQFGVPVVTVTSAPAPASAASMRLERAAPLTTNPSLVVARWRP